MPNENGEPNEAELKAENATLVKERDLAVLRSATRVTPEKSRSNWRRPKRRGFRTICTKSGVAPKSIRTFERFAKFLHRHQGEVFAYLKQTGLDATNWRAEQAIRPAVVNRKVWSGSRTANGAQAQGILMSVLRTALQHGNDALEFLAQTLRAPPNCAPRLIAVTT